MRLLAASATLVASFLATAQPVPTITTIAGGASVDPGIALGNPIERAMAIAGDGAGGLFVLTPVPLVVGGPIGVVQVIRLRADGTRVVYAGEAGASGFAGDGGPATAARFNQPFSICGNDAGVLYVADWGNHRVRRIDAAGNITTFAGNGVAASTGDGGAATGASLNNPIDCAVDTDGSVLISEASGYRIRRVSTTGVISTVAGTGQEGGTGDGGPALLATMTPTRIAIDGAGGFYFYNYSNGRVRKVNAAGTISHYAGNSVGPSSHGDGGPATSAGIPIASDLTVDAAGNLYIADSFAGRLRRVDTAGIIDTVAGDGGAAYVPGINARSIALKSLSVTHVNGVLYVGTETQVYRMESGGLHQVAGVRTSPRDGDGSAGLQAILAPNGLTHDGAGGILFTNGGMDGAVVRRLDAGGMLSTFAGTGATVAAGVGGPATAASFELPVALSRDNAGNVYVVDSYASVVRRIDGSGVLHSFAGTGADADTGDGGPATAAGLHSPQDVLALPTGDVLIVTAGRVRRVAPDGTISTFAGGGSVFRDDVPATQTLLYARGIAADAAGNVYIADQFNHRVRRVDTAGIITTVAGNGVEADNGDGGPAVAAAVMRPEDVAVDSDGNLYIATGYKIRRVGLDGVITRFAGANEPGSTGDGGPAIDAKLEFSPTLMIHPDGYMVVADRGRLRKITLPDTLPVPFSFAPVTGVGISTPVTSAGVAVTGINVPTPIAVAGGEYSIGCNGTFTTQAATISNGETVCVRHVASGVHNNDQATTLTVGGRSAVFTSTTVPGPGGASLGQSSVDLGSQSMYTTSPPGTVTVTNTSGVTITLNRVSATNGFAGTTSCGTLAPGASCTVEVTMTPPSSGTVNGTVTIHLSSGNLALAVSGIGERSLATHYYRAILGRAPDAAGKAFWDGEATRAAALGANPNEAWYAMAATFFSSPEYRGSNPTDAEFLADLYNTFFNRAGDSAGLAYWQGQLDAGLPREMLVTSFTFSTEFVAFTRAIFGLAVVRPETDLVMDLYRGYLSRLPDDVGFNHWVGRLRAIQCLSSSSPEHLMRNEVEAMTRGFIESAEYAARARTDGQFLADTYAALFRRGADVPGFNYWKGQLGGGMSRDAVRAAMIAFSPEFLARIRAAAHASCTN